MKYDKLIEDAVPCKGTIRVPDPEKTRLRDERLVAEGKKPGTVPAKKSVRCNCKPKIVSFSGLFYAQCTRCNKWDPYQFLGSTPRVAIEQWNLYNSKNMELEDD